jgi:hypothetical protein
VGLRLKVGLVSGVGAAAMGGVTESHTLDDVTVVKWLVTQGVGPAAVGLPVTWTAQRLAGPAKRWIEEALGRDEDTLRALTAAAGVGDLSPTELSALRELLSLDATWNQVAGGTTEDLEQLVASCFPPGEARSAEEVKDLAAAVARNLLGFQLSDLDEDMFREYLAGLLERLRMDTLDGIDEAFLQFHDDLVSTQDQTRRYFGKLFAFLRDRLPPGPAGPRVLRIYLMGLIDKLDDDPWPIRENVNAVAPRPSEIERRLEIRDATPERGAPGPESADEIADQSELLVVLGGPGAGKSWFAKRTARRAAQVALNQLDNSTDIADIEVPIYATCQHFLTEGGSPRRAVFAAAERSLPDLGSTGFADAVAALIDNHPKTLLVLDSLDEAPTVDSDRLQSAADIAGWRLLLTSRPSAWNHQIKVKKADPRHAIAELQQLSYPEDVNHVIDEWLNPSSPEAAERLKNHLSRQPARAQAARTPLICALYCIVGTDGDLPPLRRDLYRRATAKLLHGRWRNRESGHIDIEAAERQLGEWAADGFDATQVGEGSVSEAIRLKARPKGPSDNVCPIVGTAEDGRLQERRFIHHTFREHLAAEHIARLSRDDAERILRPHLWFDPTWENIIPAAIGAHPEGPALAERLLLPTGAHPDLCDQLSHHLAALAVETSPNGWAAVESAVFDARMKLVDQRDNQPTEWHHHDAQVARAALELLTERASAQLISAVALLTPTEEREQVLPGLLGLLESEKDRWVASELVDGVVQLASSPEQTAQVLTRLLGLLESETNGWVASELVDGVVQLGPSPEQTAQVLTRLLGLLESETDRWAASELVDGVVQLASSPEQTAQVLTGLLGLLESETNGWGASELVDGVVQLGPSPEQAAQVLPGLLGLLESETDRQAASELVGGVVQLASLPEQTAQVLTGLLGLLESETDRQAASVLVGGVVQLASLPEQTAQVLPGLLGLLESETVRWVASELVDGVVQLSPSPEQTAQVLTGLLGLLESETNGWGASELVDGVVQLSPSPEQAAQVLPGLLGLLESETNGWVASVLVGGMVQLSPSPEQTAQALTRLLGILESETVRWVASVLVDGVMELESSPEQAAQVLTRLLGLLESETDKGVALTGLLGLLESETNRWVASELVGGVVQLASSPEQTAQVLTGLLGLLESETNGWVASELVGGVVQLASSPEQTAQVLTGLLGLLESETNGWVASELVDGVVQLASSPEQTAQVLTGLLGLLESETNRWVASELVDGVVQLGPSPEQTAQALTGLLGLLESETDGQAASVLVDGVVQLGPSPEQTAQALTGLLGLLESETSRWGASRLVGGVVQLASSPEQTAQVLPGLLGLLESETDGQAASVLVDGVVQLASSPEQAAQVLTGLLGLLESETNGFVASRLVDGVVQLEPTSKEVIGALPSKLPGARQVLAATRSFTEWEQWNADLPALNELWNRAGGQAS